MALFVLCFGIVSVLLIRLFVPILYSKGFSKPCGMRLTNNCRYSKIRKNKVTGGQYPRRVEARKRMFADRLLDKVSSELGYYIK